jgi:uncharacterized hydrophobic protein (TIGR00341 family)
MSLRLIEIVLPEGFGKDVEEALKEQSVLDIWQESIEEKRIHLKVLVPTGQSEVILDLLEKRFSHLEGFRIILLPVEASIPRPKQREKPQTIITEHLSAQKLISRSMRISREELYADIEKTVRVSWVFILLVIFSAIVASIGILRNNVVFIIGAMVLAPVLGPNVALSFATTLGDVNLSRKALRTLSIGIFAVFVSAFLVGVIQDIDPEIPELVIRTKVSLGDVILALVAGSAAVISFTSELFSALIGVMMAVALLPPLVTLGMLVGSGQWKFALGSLLLFLINLICINLAGVVTFLVQGIRPLSWWESTKAKKATRLAIILWAILLIILVFIILLSQKK